MTPSREADPPPDVAWRSINSIRALAMDAVEQAQSGHPGTPMALAPAAYVLWTRFLRHNPRNPDWADRDRFVLSCGHASMLLYSLLHLSGYDLPLDEIRNFRQWGSRTPGHPERGHTPGVETTTGPLGQGFGNAVGMAIAERFLADHFNRPEHTIVDHRIWVFASDGDLMEGVASETASLAGHLRLGKLNVIYDDNHITIDGDTALTFSEDVAGRFEAYGWHVLRVGDGNDLAAIGAAYEAARSETSRPSLIILRTTIADPAPTKRNTAEAHGSPARRRGGPAHQGDHGLAPGAEVPPPGRRPRRLAPGGAPRGRAGGRLASPLRGVCLPGAEPGRRVRAMALGRVCRTAGTRLCPRSLRPPDSWPPGRRPAWLSRPLRRRSPTWSAAPPTWAAAPAPRSSRAATSGPPAAGRTFHWGVREHGMAACLNGIAAHGGLRPFGSTFLVFSDYMKPAIRLAAIMRLPVIYIGTHDSIGVGEDGPTHQPVEHLAMLRSIPNLVTLRPADAAETIEAWRVAMERRDGPTMLVLTRQKLPVLDRSRDGRRGGSETRSLRAAGPARLRRSPTPF